MMAKKKNNLPTPSPEMEPVVNMDMEVLEEPTEEDLQDAYEPWIPEPAEVVPEAPAAELASAQETPAAQAETEPEQKAEAPQTETQQDEQTPEAQPEPPKKGWFNLPKMPKWVPEKGEGPKFPGVDMEEKQRELEEYKDHLVHTTMELSAKLKELLTDEIEAFNQREKQRLP